MKDGLGKLRLRQGAIFRLNMRVMVPSLDMPRSRPAAVYIPGLDFKVSSTIVLCHTLEHTSNGAGTGKLRMTDSIKAIEKIILTSKDDQKQIQAVHAMSGLVKRYAEILKVTDLEKRIQALEQKP